MPTHYGALVGALLSAAVQTTLVPLALKGGSDRVFIRDRITVDAAQNDLISLGSLPSTAIINPTTSFIQFGDLGTSVTMDVGSAAAENALVAAADVATAAGSVGVLASVAITDLWKPLWELLGLSEDPGGFIELFAKLEGANPASGTVAWQICGQDNR
ncbi:hypothetical protein [Phenylobacterium sp.]|uniref:hypothetical protein n=1 Tax=Phenylobacterium sp. TaxID=1871053 RepID=UPI002FCBE88B